MTMTSGRHQVPQCSRRCQSSNDTLGLRPISELAGFTSTCQHLHLCFRRTVKAPSTLPGQGKLEAHHALNQ